MAYRQLPVSALPQVDYPTIQVRTFYPGASPDVMASSVTAPLERQFGQMPGLTQMTSTSSGGSSVITLQFSLDLSLDVAEQEVQAAINAGFTFLPRDLPIPPVYSKVNPADTPILTLALTSDTLRCRRWRTWRIPGSPRRSPSCRGLGWSASAAASGRPSAFTRTRRLSLRYGLTLEDLRTASLPRTSTRPRVASTARARPTSSAPTISSSPARITGRWSSPTETGRRCTCPTWPRRSTMPRT